MAYPKGPAPALPDRYGGALRLEAAKCPATCAACVPVCPTQAIVREPGKRVSLDLGNCIFCAACVAACPTGCLSWQEGPDAVLYVEPHDAPAAPGDKT